ncbi:translation initiation factor IF-2 N-terminal domain-containing protein [Amycolatopsis taiwanensis]|uniref:translation initiation factor IF-2 N-terminal domain-containing protein n=1 Tax=Amycolatopsis taiwanensis TaxID=342230 RepID=UPI000487E064|nr:translation initiation factor IF-2 N-terminal domain-containing protein [Amycolatopsis taiwanensis]
MSNTETPAAGGNIATPTSGGPLGELPPRVRVHALAKLLGLNSRDVLAKLTELGEPARSAQSSVPRETAIRVADAFTTQAEPEPEPTPEPEPEPQPAPEPEPEPEPVRRPLAHAPVFAAPSPLFLPPEPPPAPAKPPVEEPAASDPEESEAEPAEEEDLGRRRRRRGRRGRGRGKGGDEATTTEEQAEETGKPDEDDQAAAETEASEEPEETEEAESTSRRRRRRRRRKSADEDLTESSDDPPNTVVHVREAKVEPEKKEGKDGKDGKSDGVRSVRGSTRLEAKRQRRRDGREAGRRRAPILSEAEFLARRESVERTMVVAERGENTQIAVLEDGVLVEHFVTSAGSGSIVGNVYLGRVQNVLPSMEAAFVDIGRGRNAVLYAGEVDWDAAGLEGKSRKIEQALSTGDNVLVQVTKDPVGHKGARLTTQISLPGRFLVYVPAGGATGISRKLPENERRRLKDILKRIVPEDAGVIIRTASEGISEEELERDVRRLKAQWEVIKGKADAASGKKAGAPTMLYEEPDLLVKVVRDLFTEDFSKLEVEGDTAWETINAYVQHVAPDLLGRLKRYVGTGDVIADYRIDEQITKALDRKVWLPSGGYLVIDRTEAMTVIDVNTGKFTGSGGNLEETVTRNNLESAEEIVRQLRLRDVGGIIVIDFIDMVLESNRELVLRRLTECLGRDRTRHQVAEVTSLGLVQMTRKKVGTGLLEAFSTTCEHCKGRGVIVSTEPQRTGGANGANGGHQHGSRRARGRGKSEETPAETRGEQAGPTPEQRESVVSAVQAMANAAKIASSGKDQAKDHEPAEPAEPAWSESSEPPEPAETAAETVTEAAAAAPPESATETPATEPVTPSDTTTEPAEVPVETAGETPEPAPVVTEAASAPVSPEPVEAQAASAEPEAAEAEATSVGAVAADAGPEEAAPAEPVGAPEPAESGTQPVTAAWTGATTEPAAGAEPEPASWSGVRAEAEATAEQEEAGKSEPVVPEPVGTVAEPSETAAGSAGPGTGARSVRRRPRRVVSRPAGPPVHASDQS